MRHKDLKKRAAAAGVLVASSPVIDAEMARLEGLAQPFVDDIKRGRLNLQEVTEWLRSGRSRSLSPWQAEEVAQIIEGEVRS